MECIFRWLQFSDIHFRTKDTTFNTTLLREKLPVYLKEHIRGNRIDAIICSGDFRFAPDKEENPMRAVEYIRNLAKSVGVTNPQKIFTVPGNHDLSRSTARKFLAQGVQGDYKPNTGIIDQNVLQELLKSFPFYERLCGELKSAPVWDSTAPHYAIELENCNLLLLNTALTAYGDEDNGKLILGSTYVNDRVSSINTGKPTIAVGHHSLDELNTDERLTLARFFDQNGIRLYLCGHTHNQWFQSFGEKGKTVTVGCVTQDDTTVKAGFCVGELSANGTVSITSHRWDIDQKDWTLDTINNRDYSLLYENIYVEEDRQEVVEEKAQNQFSIEGYTLLGALGCDGIKYYWKKDDHFVESIAFNKRLKEPVIEEDDITSAYTISTSFGCQLSAMKQSCRFCETGAQQFGGNLSAEDIALQCIFMAEYDSNCPSYPAVRNHMREFAFMGQGEPGYNYPAIKQAIIMNDYVMERLGQHVSRYIISTCGVSGLIPTLIQDVKSGLFKNKVTVHLSLHDIDEARDEIMPINRIYSYKESIEYCKSLYRVTHEKIGVGILMFDRFHAEGISNRTLTLKRLEKILSVLDKEVFRIDLCAVNNTSVGKQRHQLSHETASALRAAAEKKGFEVKVFTSFGDNQHSGCGMLSSYTGDVEKAGNKTISHFNTAVSLLHEAKKYFVENL